MITNNILISSNIKDLGYRAQKYIRAYEIGNNNITIISNNYVGQFNISLYAAVSTRSNRV